MVTMVIGSLTVPSEHPFELCSLPSTQIPNFLPNKYKDH